MSTAPHQPEAGAAAWAAIRAGLDTIESHLDKVRDLLTGAVATGDMIRRRIDALEAGLRPTAPPAFTPEQQQTLLIEAYLSGQVSAAQWEAHKAEDPALAAAYASYTATSHGA